MCINNQDNTQSVQDKITEQEREEATRKLLAELEKAERSVEEHGWLTEEEVEKALGLI